jgi:hypothetical protein
VTQTGASPDTFDAIPKSDKATAENDYMKHPAEAAWSALNPPWRRCMALAWEAYGAGTIPVGAVVADPADEIVAEGRNQIYGAPQAAGSLIGTVLAHAEVSLALGFSESGVSDERTDSARRRPNLVLGG